LVSEFGHPLFGIVGAGGLVSRFYKEEKESNCQKDHNDENEEDGVLATTPHFLFDGHLLIIFFIIEIRKRDESKGKHQDERIQNL